MEAREKLNSRVLELIEDGKLDWRKPWNASAYRPHNPVTKTVYRGVNFTVLGFAPYTDPRWLTFKNIHDLGGSVKKDNGHYPIIFGNWVPKKSVKAADVNEQDNSTTRGDMFCLYLYFRVWNVEQTIGCKLPPKEEAFPIVKSAFTPIERAEQIIANMPHPSVKIEHGGDMACYSPTFDRIAMPHKHTFDSAEAYYATLFHEIGHATGAENRLNRAGFVNSFGSEGYSKEELIAELASVYVSAECGIDSRLDASAAYIGGWMKKFKEKPKLLAMAAGQAQKAADWILNAKNEPAE